MLSARLQKAAKMLLALGPEQAANVLKHLDKDSIEKLTLAIAEIEEIDSQEADALLGELRKNIQTKESLLKGGKETAYDYIVKSLGEEKAKEYKERLDKADISKQFLDIEEYPPETVASVLQSESAQMIALSLAHLSPKFAAKILHKIESQKRVDVTKRLAKLNKVSPLILENILGSLLKKLEAIESETEQTISGENQLSEILGFLDKSQEENVLKAIEEQDLEMAERIRSKLYIFDDILNLNRNEIRKLIEQVNDQNIWAHALKGVSIEVQRHVLSCISTNRASDLRTLMDEIGPIYNREAHQYRKMILEHAMEMEKNGEIFLHKDREELIE